MATSTAIITSISASAASVLMIAGKFIESEENYHDVIIREFECISNTEKVTLPQNTGFL